MKAGYYKTEMVEVEAVTISEAAQMYADENHEVVETSDYEFTLFVEDNEGRLHEVKMYTEFDPRFEVSSCLKI